MREKLIELLRKTRYEYRRYIGMKDMEKRMAKTEEEFLAIDDSIVGEIPFCADHLIANGVTVTDNNVGGKWIPVTERLPKEHEYMAETQRGEQYYVRLLIAYMTDTVEYEIGYYDGWKWMTEMPIHIIKNVVAWKPFEPLPEPPKGE